MTTDPTSAPHPDCSNPDCLARSSLASATGGGFWCVICAKGYTALQALTNTLNEVQRLREVEKEVHELRAENARLRAASEPPAIPEELEQTDFDLGAIERTHDDFPPEEPPEDFDEFMGYAPDKFMGGE